MATTKMTRKGQVTIPADIRNELELHEGTRFIVRREGDRVVLETEHSVVERLSTMFSGSRSSIPPTKNARHQAFAQAVVEDYLESDRGDDA